jgi:3-methyladenine DNA glycosylase/8-oxoguanine DNA glycosylase
MQQRTITLALPVDLRQTLGPLSHGAPDHTIALRSKEAIRAVRTPAGPVCVHVHVDAGRAHGEAWGPGAVWILDHLGAVIGAEDDLSGFLPHDRAVDRAHRRRPGLRIARSGTVSDVLVPTILAQKVTGLEAARAWLRMLRSWGEPAPGPRGMRLPPSPERLASEPYHAYHRMGVERRRAETIIAASRRADWLQDAARVGADELERRLLALPGIGPWTAAIVRRVACGDADAVEVGDFHIPNHVVYNLTGRPRGDDNQMLELLAPYRGHRGRVVRLLGSAAPRAPAYGPRMAARDIRHL